MDFFGAQENARRSTGQLVTLFVLAVACLVILTNVLIAAVYGWASNHVRPQTFDPFAFLTTMPVEYWLWISAGVVGVVALASGVRYLQVKRGGRTIAEALGGRLMHHGSTDFRERRLLNVVEEMAIASGIPVPPVYVIDEPSINAFAAGFGPDDAVIGVNRGTLEHLSRDELQGVIGHEFSHVLNGDSRINLRLVAVLHGILFIGLVGRGILRGVGRGSGRRRGRSGGGPVLALALGLLVIGYAGIFFGNLIKAAVSRQRELLADAASVQFTRNPHGIAGALMKIGGLGAGSTMRSAAAGEMSHMFFGQSQRFLLTRLMATHPPLEQRIRAVDPTWNGRFPVLDGAGAEPADRATGGHGAPAFAGAEAASASALEIHATPDEVVAAVGRLDQSGLDQAAGLLNGLPEPLKEAAHDPFAARALMYACVLAEPGALREAQLDHLRNHAEPGVPDELATLLTLTGTLDEPQKLTLVEIATPALKELSEPQYARFMANLTTLIKSDEHIDLMEWVLHRLLVKELEPHFTGRAGHRPRHGSVRQVGREAVVLLSALAREGGRTPEGAAAAFGAGQDAVGLEGTYDSAADPNFSRLNDALRELRLLNPLRKPQLIKACAATVLADGHVSAREGALLQGVAAALDCPLPPTIYRTWRIDRA